MPYPASLIANAFVKKGIEEKRFVTQMKLQKMVYFAHGYYLAKYGEPLIYETVEAWKFGPVIQSIYSEYQVYGINPITEISGRKTAREIQNLSSSAKEAIEYTWEVTKELSAYTLSNWTHQNNSPWASAYSPGSVGTIIPNDKIRQFFIALLIKNGNGGKNKAA